VAAGHGPVPWRLVGRWTGGLLLERGEAHEVPHDVPLAGARRGVMAPTPVGVLWTCGEPPRPLDPRLRMRETVNGAPLEGHEHGRDVHRSMAAAVGVDRELRGHWYTVKLDTGTRTD